MSKKMATHQAAEDSDLVAMQAASDLAKEARPPPEYITLAEAAKLAGLSQVAMRHYAATGNLPAAKRGGRNWWVDVHDLWLWMSERSS
jgi:hypothetical protein